MQLYQFVLVVVGIVLLFIAVVIRFPTNWKSWLVFKFVPLILGVVCILLAFA